MTKLRHRAVKSFTGSPANKWQNLLYDPGSLTPKRELLPILPHSLTIYLQILPPTHTSTDWPLCTLASIQSHPGNCFCLGYQVCCLHWWIPFGPHHSFFSLCYCSYIQELIEHLHCVRLLFYSSKHTRQNCCNWRMQVSLLLRLGNQNYSQYQLVCGWPPYWCRLLFFCG